MVDSSSKGCPEQESAGGRESGTLERDLSPKNYAG